MQLTEIMERLEDVSISLDMEKAIEMSALTKDERREARVVKRALRKERRKLEKEVEKELTGETERKRNEKPESGKVMIVFGLFLTLMSFVEAYLTFV